MSASVTDRDLIARHRAGDRRARAMFIERYLPLARHVARRYRNSGEPLDDLVQVASLGLVKAADRWEPERGLAFSTYAVPTVLGELRRYFRDLTWSVRPPRAVQELVLAVERSRERLYAIYGREPTTIELAALLDQPPQLIAEALQARDMRALSSLDTPLADDEECATLGEQIGGDEDEFRRAESRVTLESLLGRLDRRAREVLRLSFHDDLTQREVGQRVGCSQMQVSRIIRGALAELTGAVA